MTDLSAAEADAPDALNRPDTNRAPVGRTLGARLEAAGRALAVRHLLAPSWSDPARVVLARAVTLSNPSEGRFERRVPEPGARAVRSERGMTEVGGDRVEDVPVMRAHRGSRPAVLPGDPRIDRPDGASDGGRRNASDDDGLALAPGRPLSSDVGARLLAILGPAAQAMRVHDDGDADALAGRHGADAVTIGRDVHLRAGRFRPDDPAGFGLLAHEARHVAAALGDGGARRATAGGPAAEEDEALAAEAVARRLAGAGQIGDASRVGAHYSRSGGLGPVPGTGGLVAQPPESSARSVHAEHRNATSGRPMTAHPDRSIPDAVGFDVEQLRRTLIGDVMRQLRSEFERGA